jgi:transposase
MHCMAIGLDVAKNIFQVHCVARRCTASPVDGAVVRRRLRRVEVLPFFEGMAPCLVGLEACASAHHRARETEKLGHAVRLMPPQYVRPYVKRKKDDATDAEAICEAVTRSTMRFVPIKSIDQQAVLMLHRSRDVLIGQRTALVNALRGHFDELGTVESQTNGYAALHYRSRLATMATGAAAEPRRLSTPNWPASRPAPATSCSSFRSPSLLIVTAELRTMRRFDRLQLHTIPV